MKYSVLALVLLGSVWLQASGDNIHPNKKHFEDAQSWPAMKPGQITLANFKPFRAVYSRTYRKGSGSRTDRVILTADSVGWDGRQAILFNMIDSGEAHYPDTNGRSFAVYFDQKTLANLFELGPVPGKAKDYFTMRLLEGEVVLSMVTTEKGEIKKQTFPTPAPGFGAPAPWLLASMPLKKGKKVRFDPVYSIGLGVQSAKAPFLVKGKEKLVGKDGRNYQTWVIESVANMTSPWVSLTYIQAQPPYLIRRESLNTDTGEKKIYMDLIDFQSYSK